MPELSKLDTTYTIRTRKIETPKFKMDITWLKAKQYEFDTTLIAVDSTIINFIYRDSTLDLSVDCPDPIVRDSIITIEKPYPVPIKASWKERIIDSLKLIGIVVGIIGIIYLVFRFVV